jgi:hypothetical protein
MGMSDRTVRFAAWALFVAPFALWLPAMAFAWATRGLQAQGSASADSFLLVILFALTLSMFPAAGVLIATRRPGTPIGWLLLAIGVGFGLLSTTTYADYGIRLHPGSVPWPEVAAAVGSAMWAPAVGLIGLLILLFPDGHLAGPRWRWLAYVIAFCTVVGTASLVLAPGPMSDNGYPGTPNPLGIESLDPLIGVAQAVVIVIPLAIVPAAVSLLVRYRRSRTTERQQIKWLVAAVATVAAMYLIGVVLSIAIPSSSATEPLWRRAVDDIAVLTIGLIPAAVGVAVLRYRLYEIDVIVRKTLIYTVLIGSLAVLYLGGIYAMEGVVRTVTGHSGALAVTLSTLAVAAAFHPLRARIQRAVDRRFYRARYDGARALDGLRLRLRGQIDLEALSDEVLEVVRDTVQPVRATLWLRAPPG